MLLIFIFLFQNLISAQNFDFTGEVHSFNILSSEKNTNFRVNNIKNNIFLNFLIKGTDLKGFAIFNFNTDFTYYEFLVDRAYLNYKNLISIFYREQIFDFNDALRILDDEIETFYQPVKFYRQNIEKFAHFGRDFLGIYFKYDLNLFKENLIIASPYNIYEDKIGNQYIIANKSIIEYQPAQFSFNFVYKKQNFPLPKVDQNNWANFDNNWFEFDTNSFYKPNKKDYQFIATGEANLKILNEKFILYAESGIDKKEGGHYLESLMMATPSGNIEKKYTWISPEWNYFIAKSGFLINFDFINFEPSFKIKYGKYKSYFYDSFQKILYIYEANPSYNEINLKFRIAFENINLNSEIYKGECSKEYLPYFYIDEYNFGKRNFIYFFKGIEGSKSYIEILFEPLKIIPSFQVNKYDFEYYNIASSELKLGILLDLTSKIEIFGNVRYKIYNYSVKGFNYSETKNFLNLFYEVKYKINNFIWIAIDYGIDPRILYDKDFGFEYSLVKYIDEQPIERGSLNPIFNAEEFFEKSGFITLRAQFKF